MWTRSRSMLALAVLATVLCLIPPTDAEARRILICIDGTNNDPNDAVPDYDDSGLLVDNGISNVLKLHILAGGRLDNTQSDPAQHSFYYVGVGNRGATSIYRNASAAFAITEPRRILDEAYDDLAEHYEPGDSVYIFGFSRGAAIARQLARRIEDQGLMRGKTTIADSVPIRFLGLWDTVAAFDALRGGDNLEPERDPSAAEVAEQGGRIAGNVAVAYHLVAVDEPRLAFRPVLMGAEDRVHEIWFPGVHSDVGGGYRDDALSDIALGFMLDRAAEEDATFIEPGDVDYDGLAPITREDLALAPDVMGRLHLNTVIDDKAYVAWLQERNWKQIMAPRRIHVSVGDRASDRPPLIHHSVLERMRQAHGSYQPPNLQALDGNYRVRQQDGSIREP